jgi:hypothetical protein
MDWGQGKIKWIFETGPVNGMWMDNGGANREGQLNGGCSCYPDARRPSLEGKVMEICFCAAD